MPLSISLPIVVVAAALICFVEVDPACAGWLERAWSDDLVKEHGRPGWRSRRSPARSLNEAYSENGSTTKDAVRTFLARYSPRSSTVLNFNMPQPDLRVELSVQTASSLEDASARFQEEIFETMERMPPTPGAGKDGRVQIPHISDVYSVSPKRFVLSLDYAPEKIVHCVAPQDLGS